MPSRLNRSPSYFVFLTDWQDMEGNGLKLFFSHRGFNSCFSLFNAHTIKVVFYFMFFVNTFAAIDLSKTKEVLKDLH